jgi:integrase
VTDRRTDRGLQRLVEGVEGRAGPGSAPTLPAVINAWLVRRGPGRTNTTYAECLQRVYSLLPHADALPLVGPTQAVAIAQELARRYRPATVALTVRAMSSLWRHGLIPAGLAQGNPWRDGAGVRAPDWRPRPQRILSPDELRRVIAAARSPTTRQLLRFLAASGLRVSEAVSLTWADVRPDPEGDSVSVTVVGKGRKTRTVHVPCHIWDSVRWVRRSAPQAPEARVWPWATRTGAWRAVHEAAQAAGLAASPHWLRHFHAAALIRAGAPLPSVQAHLGHARMETTAGYLGAIASESPVRYLQTCDF